MHAYNEEGIPDAYKLSLRERVALKLNKGNNIGEKPNPSPFMFVQD